MMNSNYENDDYTPNLLNSDLSSLLNQIDELTVKAFKVKKNINKEGRREIESFSNLLSEMLSRLKPWVPRLKIVLSSTLVQSESKSEVEVEVEEVSCDESNVCNCESPQERTLNTLVSPSPLVQWRANCTVETGKQMFMLTPLPFTKALLSSKPQQLPKKLNFTELAPPSNNSMIYSVSMKPKQTPMKPALSIVNEDETKSEDPGLVSSPVVIPKTDTSILVMMTPCLKMSPPKSCVLLEPISEVRHVGIDKVRKSTPFPRGVHYNDSEDSESSGTDDASRGLALRYPELMGIQQRISKTGIAKKTVEESPVWLTSPPKTCVLLGTPDEKSLELEKADNESPIKITESILKPRDCKLNDGVSKDHNQTKQFCDQDNFVGNLSRLESTPMWLEPESSLQTGKRPGENTLKRELWTRFEAATTTCGFEPSFPTVRKNSHKGFLDLLEEASCDD